MAVVFLDIDGTLYNNKRKEISDKTIEAIKLLKGNNHEPIIATGRIPFLCQDIFATLGIDSYICANGNYVVYQGKLIYRQYICKNICDRLISKCQTEGFDVAIEYDEQYLIHYNHDNTIIKFNEIMDLKNIEMNSDYYHEHEVLQMVACIPSEKIEEFRKEFPELQFNLSNKYGYDINVAGSMKDNGVRVIEKLLGLKKEDMYAFGDGYNDISIIKYVGTGIAMGNGNELLKKEADFITLGIDFDAIFFTLKYYNLI